METFTLSQLVSRPMYSNQTHACIHDKWICNTSDDIGCPKNDTANTMCGFNNVIENTQTSQHCHNSVKTDVQQSNACMHR